MQIDPYVAVVIVSLAGFIVAALPSVMDALDRRARRNATIDLTDQAQKFDFARDTIAGKETTGWKDNKDNKNNAPPDS